MFGFQASTLIAILLVQLVDPPSAQDQDLFKALDRISYLITVYRFPNRAVQEIDRPAGCHDELIADKLENPDCILVFLQGFNP